MSKLYIKKDKLINYMRENNLSERELANIIGIDHTMINRVLRGKRNPGPKFVAGILEKTDFNFNDIFFTKELPAGNNPNQKTA